MVPRKHLLNRNETLNQKPTSVACFYPAVLCLPSGGQEQLPPAPHRHGADAKKLHFAVLPCSLQYFSIAYPKLKATSVHSDFLGVYFNLEFHSFCS